MAKTQASKPATQTKVGKVYYERDNVGTTKYTVNFHDGVQTHKDGSEFFGIRLFSNKRKRDRFIRDLQRQGYKERGFSSLS